MRKFSNPYHTSFILVSVQNLEKLHLETKSYMFYICLPIQGTDILTLFGLIFPRVTMTATLATVLLHAYSFKNIFGGLCMFISYAPHLRCLVSGRTSGILQTLTMDLFSPSSSGFIYLQVFVSGHTRKLLLSFC